MNLEIDKTWLEMRETLRDFAGTGRDAANIDRERDYTPLFSQRENPGGYIQFYEELEVVFNEIARHAKEISTRYNRKKFAILVHASGLERRHGND